MLGKIEEGGDLKGFKAGAVAGNGVSILLLLFVDDTILFRNADPA